MQFLLKIFWLLINGVHLASISIYIYRHSWVGSKTDRMVLWTDIQGPVSEKGNSDIFAETSQTQVGEGLPLTTPLDTLADQLFKAPPHPSPSTLFGSPETPPSLSFSSGTDWYPVSGTG